MTETPQERARRLGLITETPEERAARLGLGEPEGVVSRALSSVGHAIMHPIDTIESAITAPAKSTFDAVVAPGVGEARHDARLSKGGNSSGRPIEIGTYDAEHGGITSRERADAAMQALASVAAPFVFRGTSGLVAKVAPKLSHVAGGATSGAFLGAASDPTDPAAGALAGTVMGAGAPVIAKAAGAVGGRALDVTGLRPSGRSAMEMLVDADALRAPQGPQARSATPHTEAVVGDASSPSLTTRVRAGSGQVATKVGIESAKDRALRMVAERFDLDNVTRPDATAFADRAGDKPVAVLDLGAGNVSGLARMAKDVPGLARRQIPEFLHERSAGTPGNEGPTLQRITGDFEQRLGLAPEDYFATADDMAAKQKAAAKVNYDKVRDLVVDDPEVLQLFDIPEFRAVHERIRANARVAGKPEIPALTSESVVGGEKITAQNPQTLGTLDLVKRQLDKIIAGKADAVGPVDRDLAYAMRGRLNTILDRMDELHPDYGTARAEYRGSAAAQDAFAQGKEEFLNADPRLLKRTVDALPPALQPLYRRGAYDALRTRLVKMKDGANIGDWLESNPDVRARIEALASTSDDAAAIHDPLQVERAMGIRKNQILGGPNTAERLIEHEAAKPVVTRAGDVARTFIPGLGKQVGALVDNSLTRRTAGQTSDIMGEVGKVMTRTGPEGIGLTFDEIERLKADKAMRALFAHGLLSRGAARGGVSGSVDRR